MAGSIGDHFTVPSGGDHGVDQRTLERPDTIHPFRGHQLGVDVLIAPPRPNGYNVFMPTGSVMHLVHQVDFLVEVGFSHVQF